MTKPKTRYPISSFGTELMSAIIRGGRERLVLKFNNDEGEGNEYTGRRKAKKFQLRIQTLRSQMREEKHPDYNIAARATVSVLWGAKAVNEGAPQDWAEDYAGKLGALVLIRPKDSEFRDVLADAGVVVSTPVEPPKAAPETPPLSVPQVSSEGRDLLDDIMDPFGSTHHE